MRVPSFLMAAMLSFSVAASAGGPMSYTEPFAPSQSEAELEQVEYVPSSASLPPYPIYPDVPAYALSTSNQRSARIRYLVTGADSITVGFYSKDGCYAINQGERIGHGLITSGDSGPHWPIVMDKSGVLYTKIEGQWYRRESTMYADEFCQHSGPNGSVTNLYLEITSVDSSGRRQILDEWSTLQFEPLMQSGSVYSHYEERRYELPAGSEELILELNSPWTRIDASGVHLSTPEVKYPVLLTLLRVDGGTDLTFGEDAMQQLPDPGGEDPKQDPDPGSNTDPDTDDEEPIPMPPASDDAEEIAWITRVVGDWWDFSDQVFEEMLTENEELKELVWEQQTDIEDLQREKEEAEEKAKAKSSSSKSTAAKSSSSSKSTSSANKDTSTSKSSPATRTEVAEKSAPDDDESDANTDVIRTREMIYSESEGIDSTRVYDVILGVCIAFGGLAAYRVYIGSVRK